MVRYEDEEEMFFESVGRIQRRGDDSRSRSPAGRRQGRCGDREERQATASPKYDRHDPDNASQQTNTSIASTDNGDRLSAAILSIMPQRGRSRSGTQSGQHRNGGTNVRGSSSPSNIDDPDPFDPRPQRTSGPATPTTNVASPKVKEPTSDDDLTEDEFERYQARYGLRHKTSASQILQGTSDEDAEDPTIGNHRTQMRLSEDGTIERKDFDWRGVFRYNIGKGKEEEERGRGEVAEEGGR
jgi:hypothetical protein